MAEPNDPGLTMLPYPRSRRLVIDAMHAGRRKHMIHGLVEFDVTQARKILHEHKERTGESLSFTAFILHCVGPVSYTHLDVYKRQAMHRDAKTSRG